MVKRRNSFGGGSADGGSGIEAPCEPRKQLGESSAGRGRQKREAGGTGFQDNFHQCDCPEKFGVQDVEIARGELHRKGPDTKMQSFWHRVSRQIPSTRLSRKSVSLRLVRLMPDAGQRDMRGKKFVRCISQR